MLELIIEEGPRFNGRGPEIRGCTPVQIVRYLARWFPDAEVRRLPWGLKFWASAGLTAPDLTAREPGLTVVGYIQEDWG